MRRRRAEPPPLLTGVPADLAAGPCVEVWADPRAGFALWSARLNWRAARDEWARAQGLNLPGDHRHLPSELRDRAPFRASERNTR